MGAASLSRLTIKNESMHKDLKSVVQACADVLKSKEPEIKLALTCLLAKGHLLIEDLPGMGKTTLANALAHVAGLAFQRVQFTSDMLPADILGSSIFDQQQSTFRFYRGPIFTQLLLADEVNRANPKTQSALLEAMAERQVSIEGETYPLDDAFFVIATQNPFSQLGTFPLPESQLDRFLLRITIGYPSKDSERAMLIDTQSDRTQSLSSVLSKTELQTYQAAVSNKVFASDTLLDYLQALIEKTRSHTELTYGLSPRGGLALIKAAKAYAFIEGRDYLIPEDIQAVWPSVTVHRFLHAAQSQLAAETIAQDILINISP